MLSPLRFRLSNLDVQDLCNARELQDLVLGLPVLKRSLGVTARRVDSGVELGRLSVLRGLAYGLDCVERICRNGREVDAREWRRKNGVCLRLRIARGAVRDLECGVARRTLTLVQGWRRET